MKGSLNKNSERIRSFIAIPLPEHVLAEIAASVASLRRDYFPDTRWVSPSAMHITLKFMGDVSTEKVKTTKDCMDSWQKHIRSYSLEPFGFGAFPNQQKPRIFWVGMKSPPESHYKLVQQIETDLAQLGFENERRQHTPHITVGRNKSRQHVIWPRPDCYVKLFDNFPSFKVKSVVLFRSTISPRGAEYSRLHETTLN